MERGILKEMYKIYEGHSKGRREEHFPHSSGDDNKKLQVSVKILKILKRSGKDLFHPKDGCNLE